MVPIHTFTTSLSITTSLLIKFAIFPTLSSAVIFFTGHARLYLFG